MSNLGVLEINIKKFKPKPQLKKMEIAWVFCLNKLVLLVDALTFEGVEENVA